MRQRLVCARATEGAASAPRTPAAPLRASLRRVTCVMFAPEFARHRAHQCDENDGPGRGPEPIDEPVRGGDRRGDVGLGRAHRLAERQALGEPGGDGRRQRAAGAVGVARGDARARRAASTPSGVDQQIDALGAAAVAALDQHRLARRARAVARACARISSSSAAIGASSSAAASGRFGVITSARGISTRRSAVDRVGRQQPVAGGRDHHRIEHDVAAACGGRGPSATAAIAAALRQHADLHRVDVEIGEHRVDLRRDEIRPARRGCR